jgi:hypothetical protein
MKQRFSDVVKKIIESYLLKVHTCIPGKIESYEPATKKATVKPLIKFKVNNETLSYPVIDNVPVVFQGTQNAIITFPISPGDGCLIIFSEQSMENYLSSVGNEVDPGDDRRYSINDAICIPGLFPFGDPGKVSDNNDNLIIEIDNANIRVNGQNIELNGNTKRFVTYTELNTALQLMVTAINANFATKLNGAGSPGTVTLDISAAETQTIKTGG